jgi:hypothetical protein
MPSALSALPTASLAQLRADLVRRFPGVVAPSPAVRRAPTLKPSGAFCWVECSVGQGGIAWLAAWTLMRIAADPLGRPALWVDTFGTLTPGDLLDLSGHLVVVRPDDPHEAHVAADIAVRAGSFSLVALEMHPGLHPKPLARLARIAASATHEGAALTPVVVWGEPPAFVAPPSGIARTPFSDAVHALFEALATPAGDTSSPDRGAADDRTEPISTAWRRAHTTDRLRPMDRAADRRPSPSGADDDARRARPDGMDIARPVIDFSQSA